MGNNEAHTNNIKLTQAEGEKLEKKSRKFPHSSMLLFGDTIAIWKGWGK